MKVLFALLALLIFSGAASADEETLPQTSLFFTPEETYQVDRLAQQSQAPGEGDLNLGAVFFYAPNDWVLWLRGEKWTPQTRRDDIRIKEVSAGNVRLTWQAEDGSGPRDITLAPNETYQISSGQVIRAR